MSWLFGYRNAQPQDFSQFVQPPASDGAGGGDDRAPPPRISQMEPYRFDSSALERAATAAKELEKSCMIGYFHFFFRLNIVTRSYVSKQRFPRLRTSCSV